MSEPGVGAVSEVPVTSRARAVVSLLAILLLAYGAARFLKSDLLPATRGLTGDFGASFPTAALARFRPDFPTSQVWPGWNYGPMMHFFTAPLLLLPRWWMVPPMWALINLAALVASFVLAARLAGTARPVSWRAFATLAGLWFLFQPLATCFASGDIEIVELALILCAITSLLHSRHRTAGLLIGAASMMKLLPIGFLAWFVMRQRWRAAWYGLLAIGAILGLATVTLGWEQSISLGTMGTATGTPLAGLHELSLTSLFLHHAGVLDTVGPMVRWLPSARAVAAFNAGVLASVLLASGMALVLFVRRRRPVSGVEIAVLLMTMFMVLPWNHDYYYVFALAPLSVLFLRAVAARDWPSLAAILVAYVLMSPPIPFTWVDRVLHSALPFSYLINYYNVPVLGGLLLWLVATYHLLAEPSGQAGESAALLRSRTVIVATMAVLGVAAWAWVRVGPSTAEATQSVNPLPAVQTSGPAGLAVSPDGGRVAYISQAGVLCTRLLDGGATTCWDDTPEAANPFFPPDGRWIGFLATSVLKRVRIDGGAVETINGPPNARTGTWDRDGVSPKADADGAIVIETPYGICRVLASTGVNELIVPHRLEDGPYQSPSILPPGDVVLFAIAPASGNTSGSAIWAQSLKTGVRTRLLVGAQPHFDRATSSLVYARDGRVMAVSFDPKTLTVSGLAVPIVGNVQVTVDGGAQFAVGANGTLAYVAGRPEPTVRRRLVWVDRQGAVSALPIPANAFESPRVSPDGRSVAVAIRDVITDVWTYDLASGASTRVTPFMPPSGSPVWSADGRAVAFSVLHSSTRRACAACPAVWSASIDRAVPTSSLQWEARAGDSLEPVRLGGWSGDGRLLVGIQHGDLWVLDVAKREPPVPDTDENADHHVPWSRALVLQTPFDERDAAISPDGHWIAYASGRSGRSEIYVQSYPNLAEPRQVTEGGGASEPVWSRDGRELFYRRGATLMAMSVTTGAVWSAGSAHALFETTFAATGARGYDVSPDGKHFLMVASDDAKPVSRDIRVLRGWAAALSRK